MTHVEFATLTSSGFYNDLLNLFNNTKLVPCSEYVIGFAHKMVVIAIVVNVIKIKVLIKNLGRIEQQTPADNTVL